MGVVGGLWAGLVCAAQSTPASQTPPADNNSAPCTVAPQPEPCGSKPASTAKPDATKEFPFPGEPSSGSSGAPSIGAPQAPDGTLAAPGAGSSAKPDATKQFPFPGEGSAPDSDAAPGTSSSSSSSSGDDSPADPGAGAPGAPGLKDAGSSGSAETPGRHILHRVNPVGTKLQTPGEREAEDLSVANFYIQSGDLQGAYLRSQDAVKTVPDDPDAHFALAEAALKLNKKDEAIAEYSATLKLDPTDKVAKASRKALQHLRP
jgi:TolA-binding protein